MPVTNVVYFPDQRGPFYCRIADGDNISPRSSQDYETVPVANWPQVFALKKTGTNEIVVLANSIRVKTASANVIYGKRWWNRRYPEALRLLIILEVAGDVPTINAVRTGLLKQYPGSTILESVPADLVLDLYSLWFGTEYTRNPCDGISTDHIPFEITIPASEADTFFHASDKTIQIAGRILYRDLKSGWRFNRSFTVKKGDFVVSYDPKTVE